MMLGRFLEIGVAAANIQDSIAFYESLGFVQALTGETWSHPYAVLTDGRLFLGLHAAALCAPRITYVQPELRRHVATIEAAGVEIDALQVTGDVFNELSFQPLSGPRVHLIEARTFSPPADVVSESACGYFVEWGWPVREFGELGVFWERLGFVALSTDNEPFPRLSLTSNGINLAFYRSRALRHPVLTFEAPDMAERIAQLNDKGFSFSDEMPDVLDETRNGVLIAPEGTRLLLLTAAD
jgi:hypothetical protein